MKIHTTQNLGSLEKMKSTNIVTRNEFSLSGMKSAEPSNTANLPEEGKTIVSFRGSKPNSKDVKKVVESTKKILNEIKKNAQHEVEKGDKFLLGSFFDGLLKVADYETVVQAAIAAVICVLLRPLTIMALPTKKTKPKEGEVWTQEQKIEAKNKDKANNIYAAAHSIASGIVGLITVFALTTPFKKGADHVMNNMMKELDPKTLKRLWPQLDLKSIVDKSGKRVDPKVKEIINGKEVEKVLWKNIDGLNFSKEIKDVEKLPRFKQLAEVSEETFSKVLGLDIDFAAQKGKSFNDIVTKDGKKLYDVIDFSKLGIKVSHAEKSAKSGEEIVSKGQILFKGINKDYLTELVETADENSLLRGLDINSVFENGKIKDFRTWKNVDGKNWKLDLDSIFIASPIETAHYAPRITGKLRFDAKEGIHKFSTYQKNGVDGSLGTEITKDMLEAEKSNSAMIKALTWLPDLSFRVPIAVGTIALIPWVLKNVFHIEKKKPAQQQEQVVAQQANSQEVANKSAEEKNVSFKGKGVPKKPNWFTKKMAEWYGKPLIESEKAAKLSEKLANMPGDVTQHMATLGSLITSSVYVQRTLSNKDMDPDRKKTLAVNQALCFVVPTIAAYTVDSMIKDKVKKIEYRYSGLKEHEAAMARINGKDAKAITDSLGKKLKGVRILAGLATFTLIYRYITPVVITPIANMIGDKLNARAKAKKEEAKVA